MTYNQYTIGQPDGATGTGATFATQLQNQLNALLHAVTMGAARGWNMTVTAGAGTAAQPQFIFYKNGVYWIRLTITWVSNNPSVVLYQFSSNSGGAYDTIGTCTITYDGSLNVTATTWS